jgi:hypothetical protein
MIDHRYVTGMIMIRSVIRDRRLKVFDLGQHWILYYAFTRIISLHDGTVKIQPSKLTELFSVWMRKIALA